MQTQTLRPETYRILRKLQSSCGNWQQPTQITGFQLMQHGARAIQHANQISWQQDCLSLNSASETPRLCRKVPSTRIKKKGIAHFRTCGPCRFPHSSGDKSAWSASFANRDTRQQPATRNLLDRQKETVFLSIWGCFVLCHVFSRFPACFRVCEKSYYREGRW